MTGWEMGVFMALVVGAVGMVVGIAWFIQWRRDPEGFKARWRRSPMEGSANHWRNHR